MTTTGRVNRRFFALFATKRKDYGPTLGVRLLAAALAGASWLAPRVETSIRLGIDDAWQHAAGSMDRL